MLFSSLLFLWIFLPFVLAGNYLFSVIPFSSQEFRIRCKNLFLLSCSLFFYAWGGIYYLFIMLGVILINFAGGICIHRSRTQNRRRGALALVVFLNLAVLFFFKYFNMAVAMVEAVMAYVSSGRQSGFLESLILLQGTGELGIEKIVLPIGVSFFIFQAMSYVIDVYRDTAPVQRRLTDFALYVAFFPQLIAGPIVQYSDIAEQLLKRTESEELFLSGQKRFCYGLAKKVLIANTLGGVADQIWSLEIGTIGAGIAWLGAVSYTLQIYYDFSGYSDMAIGLGKMFGFHFRENFNVPYIASSVQEFWRRWHISLSSWFKSYVYIPLGGNRKGTLRTCRNMLIVFLLTGIWHGANFTFIFWGLLYAVLLIAERLFLGRILKKNPVKILNHVYVLGIVMIGWIIFRSDNILEAGEFIRQLFLSGSGNESVLSYLSMKVLLALAAGILGSGFLQNCSERLRRRIRDNIGWSVLSFACQILLLAASILSLAAGTYNPFIYFQF